MRKTLVFFLALVMVVACFSACDNGKPAAEPPDTQTKAPAKDDTKTDTATPAKTEEGPIIIGINEAITGPLAGFGSLETEGMEFAHELRPTCMGREVKLVISDNKSDKVEASTVATKLIDQDKAVFLLGCSGSTVTMAMGEVIKQKHIPAIAPTATNPLVTEGNPWMFRMCFIDSFQGQAMAKYGFDQGYKKIAILREVNNDFCVGLARFFTETFTSLTGDENSVVMADFQGGDQDFSSQITTMMQEKPDAFFIPAPSNFGDTAIIAKQLRQLGHTLPILGSDGVEVNEIIALGGEAIEGIRYSSAFDTGANLSPSTKTFIEMYTEKFKAEPGAFSAMGFDAYNLALDAIEKAGSTDPEAIRTALKAMDQWEGAGGYVTFDENNNPNKPAVIKVIKDGKFVYEDIIYFEG